MTLRTPERPISASDEPRVIRAASLERALFYPLLLLLIFFVVLMIKTAWMGDDAYISFRPIDNLLNGYGLRWNVAERVQVYTDPAWLMLVLPFYAITHEIYLTVLVLSIVVSFFAVFLLLRYLASSNAAAIAGLCAFISSKAFIDYTTSGLENAFGYLLVACFCVCLLRPLGNFRKLGWLIFFASLAAFNRLDSALLFVPAIAYTGWICWRLEKVAAWPLVRRAFLCSFPLWGWTLFSLVYFGFAFPNTYYAKLYTGLPKGEVFTQGILYYLNSFDRDPVTLITLVLALSCAYLSRDPRLIAGAIGISLYLFYIVKIGGDFMSGRFFSVPLVFGLALLISLRLRPIAWLALALSFFGLGLLGRDPSILSNESYSAGRSWEFGRDPRPNSVADGRGIADERAAYYASTGLLHVLRHDRFAPTLHWKNDGEAARERGRHFVVFETPGFYGFYAGPEVHIIDTYALGDPLLSKLPVLNRDDWRIGHFRRAVPKGYVETLQTGINLIRDPQIRELYRSIKILTRDPIWSGKRFREIAKMNLGFYNRAMRSITLAPDETALPAKTVYPWPRLGERTQIGRLQANVKAGWGRESDAGGHFWWANKEVELEFALPQKRRGRAPLVIPVWLFGRDVSLQFVLNGTPVSAEPGPPVSGSPFAPMRIRGPWKAGRNVIQITGTGEPVRASERAARELLFAVRTPFWE